MQTQEAEIASKHKKGKGKQTDVHRSSCTMFYVNYSSNLSLSEMADRKAHLLIGLNLLILSFFIARKHMGILPELQGYFVPNLLLIVSCVVCSVLALLVARPILPRRNKSGEPVNWFFFGSFRHHSLEEFHQAIFSLQQDKDAIYEAMSRDLYWMGLSLARKYRLLSHAYLVFLCCQMVTVVAYLIVFAWHQLH